MRPEPLSAPMAAPISGPNTARRTAAVPLTILAALVCGCAAPAGWDAPAAASGAAGPYGRHEPPASARPRSGFRLLAPPSAPIQTGPAQVNPVQAGRVPAGWVHPNTIHPVVYEDSAEKPDTNSSKTVPAPAPTAGTPAEAGWAAPLGPHGGPTLSADEARCRAALRTAPVALIALEWELVEEKSEKYACLIREKVVSVTQEILSLRAALRGNEAAEGALRLFNGLAEGERQLGVIDASLAEVEQMQSDLERLQERGFDTPIDEGELERQRLELLAQRRQIVGQMASAWAQLAALIGEPATCDLPPWHFALDLHAPTPCPPADDAVGTALQARPELRLYRLMLANVDTDLLDAAVSLLQQAEVTVGTADRFDVLRQLSKARILLKPLIKLCPGSDVEIRKQQLGTLLARRQEAVAGEVYAALAAMAEAADRWHLADRRVASWRGTIDRLEKRRDVDETVTVFDVSQARLGLIQAEGEQVAAYFEWRAALIDLWTAQGIAAAGCGLPCHGSYWCQSCQATHGIPSPAISAPAPEPAEPNQDQGDDAPKPPAPAEPAPKMIDFGPDLRVTPTHAVQVTQAVSPSPGVTPIPQFITAPAPSGSPDASASSFDFPAGALHSLGTCRPIATLRNRTAR